MIKEAYCSFEVSKLLKEKGFNERSSASYDSKGQLQEGYGYWNKTPIWYAAPTHQMAMKWLREVRGLSVEIFSIKGASNICPVFWKSNVVKLLEQDRVFNGELVGSYEESVEVALKYTLENLI